MRIRCFRACKRPVIPSSLSERGFFLPTHCHRLDSATLPAGGVGPPARCQAWPRVSCGQRNVSPLKRTVSKQKPFTRHACSRRRSSLPSATGNARPRQLPFSLGSQNEKHVLATDLELPSAAHGQLGSFATVRRSTNQRQLCFEVLKGLYIRNIC